MGHAVRRDDLLSYLLYPDVFAKYDKFRQTYADVSVLPTPAFYYGLASGEEITVEIEPGKTLILKFLTAGDPHPDGTRTLVLRIERAAARSQRARPCVARRRARPSESRPRRSGPSGRADGRCNQRNRRASESSRGTRSETLDARSHENAIKYLRADLWPRRETTRLARAARRSQRSSGDHRP